MSQRPTHPRQALVRAAVRLRAQYLKRSRALQHSSTDHASRLDRILSTAQRWAEHLAFASRRGWSSAAENARLLYRSALRDLDLAVHSLQQGVDEPPAPVPSLRDLFEELLAVQEDFGELTIDGKAGILSVVTDDIELDGTHLGPFRLELCFREIGDPTSEHLRWFKAVAVQPRPASGDSAVTHPHVSQDRVCTGEATAPIKQALTSGRLSEFFLLLRSVLETYNAGSAYVRLEDWDGVSCADCGDSCSVDEMYFCEACEQDHCSECIRTCIDCHHNGCRNCLQRSEISRSWVCSECQASCERCDRSCAGSELNEAGLCDDCQARADEEAEEDSTPEPSAQETEVVHGA